MTDSMKGARPEMPLDSQSFPRLHQGRPTIAVWKSCRRARKT